MATQAFLKVMPGPSLQPASPFDADELESLNIGEVIRAEIYKPRNYRNLKRFFAMIRHAHGFEQVSKMYPSPERFRRAVLIAAGFVNFFPGFDPRTGAPVELIEAQSISFGAMEETEFRKVFSACVDAILQRYLFDQDSEELEEQFHQILEFV